MSRKNNSKPVFLDEGFYEKPAATVEPLHLDQLKLKVDGFTSYFSQLLYKGAPNYLAGGLKIKGVDYIPVEGREVFVRDVYRNCAYRPNGITDSGPLGSLILVSSGSAIPVSSGSLFTDFRNPFLTS